MWAPCGCIMHDHTRGHPILTEKNTPYAAKLGSHNAQAIHTPEKNTPYGPDLRQENAQMRQFIAECGILLSILHQ